MSGLRELLERATPGPWRVQTYDGAEWRILNNQGWLVASCDGRNLRQPQARAALIALAPEMAELLLDMSAVLAPLAGRPDPLTDEIDALLARLAALTEDSA